MGDMFRLEERFEARAYLAAMSGKHFPGCFCRRECKSPPEQYSITKHEN